MISEQFNQYLKKNTVENLIHSTTKIVLVCESPHTEELEIGRPLVGGAGKSALKGLGISNDKGLGEYLYDNKLHTVGIMNVCRAPLQKTKSKKQSDFDFDKLSKIRNGYKSISRHKDKSLNKIESCIMDDFRTQINKLAKCNDLTKIIVCGEYARHYFNAVWQMKDHISVGFLPHPANRYRKGWLNLSDEQKEILGWLKHEIPSQIS